MADRFLWDNDVFKWGPDTFTWGVAAVQLDDARLLRTTVEVRLQGVWTEIQGDILGSIVLSAGTEGNSPLDRVAEVGRLAFTLDARDGRYNPRRASALVGWGQGERIRVIFHGINSTSKTRWTGSIETIKPTAGTKGDRVVYVTAVDWMEYGATRVRPPIQENVRADQAIMAAVDTLPLSDRPPAFLLDTGSDTYEYAFFEVGDGQPLRALFQRIAQSEHGFIFVDGDETLCFRNRSTPTVQRYALGDGEIPNEGLDIPESLDDAYTEVQLDVHPLRVDSARRLLYEAASVIAVPSGETITIVAAFKDPDEEGTKVGGFGLGGHVYAANERADGSGLDLASAVSMQVDNQAGSARVTFANTGGVDAFITTLQLYGQGVYDLQPVTIVEADATANFLRSVRYDARYLTSPSAGRALATRVLDRHKSTDAQVHAVSVEGKRSIFAAEVLANVDVGDGVEVTDAQTGAAQAAEVRGWKLEVDEMERITGSLMVVPPNVP